MKKVFWFLLLLLIGTGAALWWYVRKDNNMYRLVPKDAHLVLSLSIPALLNEVSLEELKKLDLMDQFNQSFKTLEDTVVAKRINELRSAGSNFGVDVFSDVVFFKSRYEGLDFYGLVFDISDPAEFRKLLNAIDPGYIIDMKANYSVMDLSDGTFLAWNKRGGIVVHNDYNYAYAKKIIRNNFIVETFSRSEGESILGLPAFQNSRNPDYLVSGFANYQAMDTAKVRVYDDGESLVKQESLLAMTEVKDAYAVFGLKHQNQALILEGQLVSFVTGLSPIDGFLSGGLSDAHVQSIAAADPLFVLGCAARNGNQLDSLVANPDLSEGWREWLNKMNLNTEEAKQLFGSEVSVAFHGMKSVPFDSQEDMAPLDRSHLELGSDGDMYANEWVFSAHLVNENKQMLDKTLLALSKEFSLLQPDGEDWTLSVGSYRFFIVKTPLGLCFTNDQENTVKYKHGPMGAMSDALMNGLTQNQMFLYANLDPATYNPLTKSAAEKLTGEGGGNVLTRQFKFVQMSQKDGRVQLKLQLVDGEEKLFNRILKIWEQSKNPIVS
jgi:Domain of unknown function (DUF4836)